MRELISLRHTACLALLSEVDHIVVLCEWTRAVLTRIGVPPEKVTLSRHGVGRGGGGAQLSDAGRPERDGARRTLRAAFLGRLDPVKGAHVLVEAIRLGPDLPVALDLYGVEQGEASAAYLSRLRKIAGGDRRITFRDPVTPGTVTTRLRPYDLIAVPSQGLETGPLVVLEAFAAGVPVLGSRLGGIAELVEDSVDGLLVEPRSPEAWRRAFERLCHEDGLLARLREGIRPPRGMDAVASEMAGLYVHVCS